MDILMDECVYYILNISIYFYCLLIKFKCDRLMEFAGSYDIVVHYSNVTPVIKNVGPMAFSYSDLLSVASDIARSMLVTEENTMIKLRYDVPTSNEGCMHYEHVVEMFIVHRMTDSIHLYVEVLINNINDDNHSLIGSNVANAEVGLLTNMSQDWENHIVTMGNTNLIVGDPNETDGSNYIF